MKSSDLLTTDNQPPPMSNSRKSQFPLAELIKSLAPITLMGKAMCVGIVIWFIDWVFVEGDLLFGSRALKEIVDVASFLALIPLTWFLIKGAHWIGENLLWRLRRRLIVTYLLIGALPLLLVLLLVTLVLLAIVGQSSVNLVGRQLDGYLEQSQAAAQSLSGDLNSLDAESLRAGPKAEQLRRQLQESADSLSPIFPDLMLSVRRDSAEAFAITVRGRSSENSANSGNGVNGGNQLLGADSPPPQWLSQRLSAGQEFHGLMVEEDAANQRRIYARHIIRLKQADALIFQLSYPIGENLCAHLSHTTDLEVKPATASFPLVMTANGPQPDTARLENVGGLEGGGLMIFKPITEWRTGEKIENEALKVDPSFILPSRLYQRVQQFKSGSVLGSAVVAGVGLSIAFFLLIALLAVISAIFLTRSITGAVHHLYEGTRRVEAGDFDHEIPITGRDQLGDLSKSFNQMTGSIRELLRVSAEKQLLDQEMKIAAAVQARLFPRSIPKSEKLEIAKGVCIPARAVSGDYYDLLDVAPGMIGIVVADVCGKGVSAALMMANLQANLRGQVQAYHDAYNLRPHPVGRIVERVNQQVAESVMDASYITFFYAEFDEQHSTLRYTNAGHNPPLLVRAVEKSGGRVEKLDRGGTVLGLFCDVEYEEGELQLESGDALVAFTDGLVEARNPSGEEFGEERLIQTLLECGCLSAANIEDRVLRTVEDWTAEAEQEDDLTLVILKVR
ncbi:MAG: PP2C family protein-serine/threonine phosphatase [Blastocatellia bacterium]